jgi:hypothetical protein
LLIIHRLYVCQNRRYFFVTKHEIHILAFVSFVVHMSKNKKWFEQKRIQRKCNQWLYKRRYHLKTSSQVNEFEKTPENGITSKPNDNDLMNDLDEIPLIDMVPAKIFSIISSNLDILFLGSFTFRCFSFSTFLFSALFRWFRKTILFPFPYSHFHFLKFFGSLSIYLWEKVFLSDSSVLWHHDVYNAMCY